ncbi:MAG: glycosyltransferase [Archangium sp.]|nr:glycosyltransferase [Archangium sp.]MDP3574843.1 glycosyltransferase [Archangium sp.]
MKILHLLASPYFTGPAEVVTQLAVAQRALGHEVFIAVDRKRSSHTSEELIVPRLEPLGLLSTAPLELSVKSTPWTMLRDVLELRSQPVDVVHAHFSHDHTIARLGRPKGARLIRSIHAPRSIRFGMPAADGFTVPMESLSRRLLGRRVLVLPSIVGPEFVPSADRAALRRELGLPEGKLVGMVSTFQASRRHELGLAAFAQHAEGSLLLVGDGPLYDQFKAQAPERVRFVGYQSGPAFVKCLQALDEVWILGLGNDWSARAAAQARACGVRVVAVDEGALARYADALVEPTVESLLAGSLRAERRELTLESAEAIATRMVAFYA